MEHRPSRDQRISTHTGLVARAFGAEGIIFTEPNVKKIKQSLEDVNETWGNSFFVKIGESWREVIKDWQSSGGKVVHLTMYGVPVDEEISKVRDSDTLVVVGAGKVPREVYELSDFNIAIGNQPHSEVAALAIFLDRFFEGDELRKEFTGGKRKIVPSESGKEVRELKG